VKDLLEVKDQENYSDNSSMLRILAVMIVLSYGLAVLGATKSFFTINYSGPVAAVIGLMALISGVILRRKLVIMGSVASLSMATIFSLMYFDPLRPHDAQYLVFVLGGICLLILIGLAIWILTSKVDY
jgi:hypothetical protein